MTAGARLGWTGIIEVPPNKAASKLFGVREEIASAFDVHESSVILSPTGTARRMRIEVYETNPLQVADVFTGPTLNLATGQCVIGHDTMRRPVHWRFWRPGWGACHGLVFGTSGAGKSSLLQRLMTEVRHCGHGVVWFFDPEDGLSAPPWMDAANFYAGADEDGGLRPVTLGLLRLQEVWAYRRRQLAAARHIWKQPTEEFPLIFAVVDEAPDVLELPGRAAIVKKLLRKGRKVGIAVVLIAQVPSLSELGNDQAIRSQAAGVNVVAFRTSDKMSANMGMPKTLPVDPVTLPEEWPDGSSTAGLAYMAGGQLVRTTWLPDDDAWIWAQSGHSADLDEGSARAAGGDYLRAWLTRHGRADEAAAVRDEPAPDNVTSIQDATSGNLRERLVAALNVRGRRTSTGVLAELVGCTDLTQVSRALRKATERGEITDAGHRMWEPIALAETTDEAVGED